MKILSLKGIRKENKNLKSYSDNPPEGMVLALCDFAWHFSRYSPALCMSQEDTQCKFWVLLNPPDSTKESNGDRLSFLKVLTPTDRCFLVISHEPTGCSRLERITFAAECAQASEA